MKNIKLEIILKYKNLLGLITLFFLYSCGSYENASIQNDGIYTSNDIVNENITQNNTKSVHYQKYFEEQGQLISDARSDSEVFTNIEDYSYENDKSEQEVNVTNDSSNNNYGGWGTQPTPVTINYIDNGFWGRNFGWGIQNNWTWGGLNPGWGWNRFTSNWGGIYGPRWGVFYGPTWAFGWSGAFGWGNFRPWGGWRFHDPWRYSYNWNNGLYEPGFSFHRNNRTRSPRVNSNRRMIRNSNFNSRVRTNRVRTNRVRNRVNRNRSQYNRNRTIRNNRENSRRYTPVRTNTTRNSSTRNSRSSSNKVRSSRGSSRSSGNNRRTGGR